MAASVAVSVKRAAHISCNRFSNPFVRIMVRPCLPRSNAPERRPALGMFSLVQVEGITINVLSVPVLLMAILRSLFQIV